MRTTLDIDEDVLMAVKELARREKRSAGAVLSDVARRGLTPPRPDDGEPVYRNGFRIVRSRGGIKTIEMVSRIIDAQGI